MVQIATSRMPAVMSPLVSRAVNKFINLNVAEQVICSPDTDKILVLAKTDGPSIFRLLPFQARCA